MPTVFSDHPTPEQLTAFGQGRLDVETAEAVADHVSDCDSCCETLSSVPPDTMADNLLARDSETTIDASRVRTSDQDDAMPDDLVDHPRYRIVRTLGSGGMGVVFQAQHRVMDRAVALKVINRQLTSDLEIVERFRQEVRAAAKLSHPNIVTAHDAEQTGDLHFLVMEYVEGVDLSRYAKKHGPLAPGLVAHIGRQVAQGLNHAAQQHMVHRDIKPQNLIMTRGARVQILDFGLARLGRKERDRSNASVDDLARRSAAELTLAGSILGTPDYIAPEQVADSRSADIRSDIYSLGCTLYYLLTGHPPYPGGSVYGKLLAHQNDTPQALADIRPDVPPSLIQIIERMMSRAPDDRFQSPAEVAKALQPMAREWVKSGGKAAASSEASQQSPEATVANQPEHAATRILASDPDEVSRVSDETDSRARHVKAVLAVAVVALFSFLIWQKFSAPPDSSPQDVNPGEIARPLIGPAEQADVQSSQRDWAVQLGLESPTIDVPLSTDVSLTLKVVPAGNFGATGDDHLNRVRSDHVLLFTDTEITIAQFAIFVSEKNYLTTVEQPGGEGWGLIDGGYQPASGFSWKNLGDFIPTDDHPATNISWYDASAFCEWLNSHVPEVGGHPVEWRLPDEWEWEFACRAGSDTDWFWGDSPSDGSKYAVVSQPHSSTVAPVRSRLPNAFGLFDMLGNEAEWCQNQSSPESNDRIQRGGSFMQELTKAQSSARKAMAPSSPTHGAFRVVAQPVTSL